MLYFVVMFVQTFRPLVQEIWSLDSSSPLFSIVSTNKMKRFADFSNFVCVFLPILKDDGNLMSRIAFQKDGPTFFTV